jgi:hypothetical protein
LGIVTERGITCDEWSANASLQRSNHDNAEWRYVCANPSFGDKKIRLNGTDYALNGFKLNGFTTTLDLGFGF